MVMSKTTLRITALVLGDIIALYASLFIMLTLRYGGGFYAQFTEWHFSPFTVVFAFWIFIFYISGLYDLRHIRNTLEFVKNLNLTIAVSAAITIMLFYLVPTLGITPKTNLFLFLAAFAIIETLWRRKFNAVTSSAEPPNRVLIVNGKTAEKINGMKSSSPGWIEQLGYKIVKTADEEEISRDPSKLPEMAAADKINIIVIPRYLKNNQKLATVLYGMLKDGIEIRDLPSFYELITRRVPLGDLEEAWFLENLTVRQKFYDPLKRAGEFLAAFIAGLVLLPLELLLTILVKLSSRGPAIYKQNRVGQRGRVFTLYKFRTMKKHDKDYWPDENDARITAAGKILRKTHLDELPQLLNILLGDISIVGPRPDFVDFYEKLEKEIPYYSVRTLVRPGLTGWAQINKPVIASVEDTKERLEYDLYYLKNRSVVLDIAIILKTIKVLFTAEGR